LYRLAKVGFSNLTGADPFLREEVLGKPVRLLRADIHAVQGRYSLINCSHALEHVPDPTSDLRAMRDRLEDGGVILLRLPVLNRFAWETYGGNWVQLDAPRHLVLFTVEGVRRLAAATGLAIADTTFDANEFMDLGSQVRQRNVFPHGPAELWHAEVAALGRHTARVARSRAKRENAAGTSDQASFFLTRS
jgi:SAM-dependent methyltransferase